MIVVDCSIMISGLLPDEEDAVSDFLLCSLRDGVTTAVVPSLFFQEVSNVLLMAYRRHRISKEIMIEYLDVIAKLPITIDTVAATQGDTMKVVCEFADSYGLTTYDACYLELSVRRDLPIATLDKNMHNVAIELGRAFQIPKDKRE